MEVSANSEFPHGTGSLATTLVSNRIRNSHEMQNGS